MRGCGVGWVLQLLRYCSKVVWQIFYVTRYRLHISCAFIPTYWMRAGMGSEAKRTEEFPDSLTETQN